MLTLSVPSALDYFSRSDKIRFHQKGLTNKCDENSVVIPLFKLDVASLESKFIQIFTIWDNPHPPSSHFVANISLPFKYFSSIFIYFVHTCVHQNRSMTVKNDKQSTDHPVYRSHRIVEGFEVDHCRPHSSTMCENQ